MDWADRLKQGIANLYNSWTGAGPKAPEGVIKQTAAMNTPRQSAPASFPKVAGEMGAMNYRPTQAPMYTQEGITQPDVLPQQDYYPWELEQNTPLGQMAYKPAPGILPNEATGVEGNGLVSPRQWLDLKGRTGQGGPKYVQRSAMNGAAPVNIPDFEGAVRRAYGNVLPPRPDGRYMANVPYLPEEIEEVATFEQPDLVPQDGMTNKDLVQQETRDFSNTPKKEIAKPKPKAAAKKPAPKKRAAVPTKMESKKAKLKARYRSKVQKERGDTPKKMEPRGKNAPVSDEKLKPMKTMSPAEKAKTEKKASRAEGLGWKARKVGNKVFSKDMRESRKEIEEKKRDLKDKYKETNKSNN